MQRILPIALLALAGAVACATPPAGAPSETSRTSVRTPVPTMGPSTGARAARAAAAMIGSPYRYGGANPSGFDCSGLVLYSYAQAGLDGLPHSAERLERLAKPVRMDRLEPGDLLFFQLSKNKTSHVAIYEGGQSFVHAPSSGKRVERVRFDHVYWSGRLGRAGRLGR